MNAAALTDDNHIPAWRYPEQQHSAFQPGGLRWRRRLGPASGTRKRNNNRERARWRKFSPLIKHDDETNFSGLLLLFSRSGCHCRRGLIARIWIYFDWGGGYSYEVELLEAIIIAPYSIFRISNAILPLAAAAVSHLPVDSTLICLFSQT